MTLCLYAGPVALVNVVHCSSVDDFEVLLDSFSFGCLNVGVYMSSSWSSWTMCVNYVA